MRNPVEMTAALKVIRYTTCWNCVSLLEAGLERQGQQESGEQLNAGLDDPQFLQQVGPVAVKALHGVSRRWPVSQALSVFGAGSFVPSG